MLKRYGPLAAVVLLAQIGIAWLLVTTLLKSPSSPERADDATERQMAVEQAGVPAGEVSRRLPYYYAPEALRRIVVNPARTNASRFMSVSVELGLKSYDRSKKPPKDDVTKNLGKDKESLAILDKYATKMRAIIRDELSKRGIDDYDRQELLPVQNNIRARINREVLKPAFEADKAKRSVVAVEMLFTELIIQ